MHGILTGIINMHCNFPCNNMSTTRTVSANLGLLLHVYQQHTCTHNNTLFTIIIDPGLELIGF